MNGAKKDEIYLIRSPGKLGSHLEIIAAQYTESIGGKGGFDKWYKMIY